MQRMGGMGPRGFLTDAEKANQPKITKDLLRRIVSYMLPYKVKFILVFITILISSVLGLRPAIITGRIVDQAIVPGGQLSRLVWLLLASLATLIASQLVSLLTTYLNAWISQHIIYDMKNQMYAHLQRMSHQFFTTEKQGDIITRMNTDISGVSSVISGTLQSILSNVATVVTSVIAMFTMNWLMALVGIVVIPLMILPTRSAGKSRWKLLTESQAKHDEMNQLINETLSVSGSLLTKLFTREKTEYERFEKVNGEVTKLSLKEQLSGRLFFLMMGIFTQIGPLLIYFVGGCLIMGVMDSSLFPTPLTIGAVTAMVSMVNRLYRPVESLLNISVDFTRSMALFTRIFDYFDRPIDIQSPPDAVSPPLDRAVIRYDHVAFGYSEDVQIFSDVSFEIQPGQMVAVVGPSGSGKSTLVNLLPRLYDVDAGSVSIAGVDVRKFDLTYLRSQIGVVTQDTYLFNGTIRDNLLYANPEATQEEIESACRAAAIHDFIASQPNGYDTEVGNRGLKLSGGEKQRISIARVILKDPRILILDEATSALDSISEAAIQEALSLLMKDRTSIVIAHRLSTILAADRILAINEGKIAQSGTHEELLAQEGIYRRLYETQFMKSSDFESESDQ